MMRTLVTAAALGSVCPRPAMVSARATAYGVMQTVRMSADAGRPRDLVVVMPLKDWRCASCGGTGDLLIMDAAGPLCLGCADLDHLVFLPRGDAALTRRARIGSRLSAVV